MSTKDIILSSAPVVILFWLFLVLCIRSIRRRSLVDWQLVAFIALGLVILAYTFFFGVGPLRYLGMAMSAAWMGTNLAGLLWQKRKRRA